MKKYGVIIVGCGVVGASTAYHLSKIGKKVLVLEQYNIENNYNASYDLTRLIRYEYGDDLTYIDMAVKSFKLWRKIEKESDTKLLFPIKSIVIGEKTDDYIKKTLSTLKNLGYEVEELRGEAFQKKYPQFKENYCIVDYNAGILEASKAVKALVTLAKKNGVEIRENSKVTSITKGKVKLFDGTILFADKVIIVCGGWVKKVLGNDFPVKPVKAQLVFFAPKKGKENLFMSKNFPAFFFNHNLVYGFPMHGIKAVKVALDERGELPEVDPDYHNREVEAYYVEKVKGLVKGKIPDLDYDNVVATKSCMYTTTKDNDFIIDKVDDKTIVGSFEGHGFKFSPLTGKTLANLALGRKLPIDISRFKLNRFSKLNLTNA